MLYGIPFSRIGEKTIDPDHTRALTSLLQLDETGPDRFRAPASPESGKRMFGGQFLAQALAAMQTTVDDDRAAHSLHAYFLRPGSVDEPLTINVERIRDGRSFSSRSARAQQGDRELFRMMASFHAPETGLDYSGRDMSEVPEPESVTYSYNDYNRDQGRKLADGWDGWSRPMDIRYVNPPTPRGEAITEDQLMWMRATERLADDAQIHAAALAYLSDSTLVDHVLLPHGLRWQDENFDGASLDHAMWFHRPARADEWLLFEQHVAWTGAGRGLATGRIFTASGALVATCVQEGLMRFG